MGTILSVLGILITIFFVIGIHEYAHFITARCLGVKVLRFSIGFGHSLFTWHDKRGTEYVIAAIPLGGYVKMLDENEGEVPEQELPFAFNRQLFYKKFLIVLAGPTSNIVSAIVLYWLVFVIGFVTIKPVIGSVIPHSIAAEAGLKSDRVITALDERPVASWTNVLLRLMTHLGDQKQVTLQTQSLQGQSTQTHELDLSHWHMDELNPNPLLSLGIKPFEPRLPLIIGVIQPGSAAAKADLRIGDKIVALDRVPIQTWEALITRIHASPNKTVTIAIKRQKKMHNVSVTIDEKTHWFSSSQGSLGIGPTIQWPPAYLTTVKYSALEAIPYAWREVTDFTYFNLVLFGKMLTGKLSLQSLGGPITIFESAGDALNSGFLAFISFLAFLSISIGIINLLPIPGLDGGHLLFQLIEAVLGRPLPDRYLIILFRLGFIFLLFVLIQALVNDILRLYL